MHANLFWSGIEYQSWEHCHVTIEPERVEVHSNILGFYDNRHYSVRYSLFTNAQWETLSIVIEGEIDNAPVSIKLESNGKGRWSALDTRLEGCIDVDIPLTPFTNTLPIRRLKLKPGMTSQIDVAYFDLLEGEVKRVRQQYHCISENTYHYQNVPNDFEAMISVDEFGFVTEYPTLFSRRKMFLVE